VNALMSLGIGVQYRCDGYSILLPLTCPSSTSAFVGENAFKYAVNATDATVVQEAGVVYATPYPVLGLPPAIAGGTIGFAGDGAIKRVQCYMATVAYNAKNGKKDEGSAVWDISKFVKDATFEAEKMQLALSVVRMDFAGLMLNIAQNGLCPRTEIAIGAANFSAESLAETIETALRFLMPQVVAYKNKTIVEFVNASLSMALAVMSATIAVIPKSYLLVERVALYSSLKLSCAFLKGMETGRHGSAVMVPWVAVYYELGRLPLHNIPARVAAELGFVGPFEPGPVFATRSKTAQADLPHVLERQKFYAQKLMGTCVVFVCASDGCNARFDDLEELHEHLGLNPTHKVEDYGPPQTDTIRSRVVAVLKNLDKAQRAAVVCFLNGNNVSLSSKAGTGKSRVVAAMIKTLKIMGGDDWYQAHVLNTAATHTAAAVNGGSTMHGAFGLGAGSEETNPPQLVAKFEASGKVEGVKKVKVVLCDEFVLLPNIVLEAACLAIESAQGADNALAAAHWFIAYDSKQLLCYDKREEPPEVKTWCKNTALVPSNGLCPWRVRAEKAGFRYFVLQICYRQLNDPEYLRVLEDVRSGEWSLDLIETIKTKLGGENPAKVIMRDHGFNTKEPEEFVLHPNGALVLVLRNDRKNWFNKFQLEENNPNKPLYELISRDGLYGAMVAGFKVGQPSHDKFFKKVPAILQCKVAAPVRLVRTVIGKMLDGTGVVTVPTGTMGVIVAFEDLTPTSGRVVIDFPKAGDRPACRVKVERERFECATGAPDWLRQRCDTRLQFPFEVAYCMTISSFQGGEARFIVVDLANYGEGWLKHSPYTSISRGLYGPGMLCINLPLPIPGKNINAISDLMLELDDYIADQIASVEAELNELRVFSFDVLSRLQVIANTKTIILRYRSFNRVNYISNMRLKDIIKKYDDIIHGLRILFLYEDIILM
jgi:hypothetical protein